MPPLTLFKYLKPCSRRKCSALSDRTAALAMNVNVLVGVQLREALRQHAQRDQRHALDMGDLVFIRLAHINHLDAQLGIVQGLSSSPARVTSSGLEAGWAGASGMPQNTS